MLIVIVVQLVLLIEIILFFVVSGSIINDYYMYQFALWNRIRRGIVSLIPALWISGFKRFTLCILHSSTLVSMLAGTKAVLLALKSDLQRGPWLKVMKKSK